MAWQTVTDVNDGGSYSGAVYQTVQDAISEIQGVIGTDETVDNAISESGSYTPTLTNFDVDDGTNDAEYVWMGADATSSVGILIVSGSLVLGTTPSVGSAPTISVPSGYNLDTQVFSANMFVGNWGVNDSGTLYVGGVYANAAGTFALRAFDASSTYLRSSAVSSTVPMTWATGDNMRWHACCRAVQT